ncbi:MAG: hypothetical protein GX774_00510, partial [Armatimonadetes bacterium]|nr:hypothetical protein [Armatimonadota bacterium]
SNASFSYDEKTFTTTISGLTLKAGNSYRLTVRNIRDLKDNRMPSTQTVNGTVEGEDEVTPPSVPTALAPADGATVSPTPAFKVKGTDPNGAQVKYVVEVTQGSTTRTYETALVASGAEALCKVPINQALSPGQISWRVKTVNASGAESTWSASRSASVPSSQPAMMGAAGVSTLGLSLQTGPISPAELGFTNAQIAQWDPATRKYLLNAEVQQVKPGVGYWVLASEPTALHFSGQPTKEPFPIQLIAGWNLISSPVMTPVVWDPLTIQVTKDGVTKSLVDATDAGWVEQYAFGWDSQAGKYVMVGDPSIPGAATQQLLPWRAYWVRARENCTLLLNPNGSIGSDSIVPPPPFRSRNRQSAKGAWGVRLQVQSNGGGAEVLLGMAGSGRAVTLGVPPLPPMKESAGTRAVLLGSQGPLSADLRTGAPSQEWEIEVQPDPTRSSDTVTLTWPDLSTLPKDVKLTLIDPATGARRYMRSTRAYSFRATDQPRRLRVVAEPRTSAPVMITEVSLVSTRANSRVVRFGLSASATVDVEVVSPSGQSVGTLARGRASDPGTNQVVWSGPARPGTYLLRITATNDEGASVRVVRPIVITR